MGTLVEAKNSNDTTSSEVSQLTSALLPRPPTNPSSKLDSPGNITDPDTTGS